MDFWRLLIEGKHWFAWCGWCESSNLNGFYFQFLRMIDPMTAWIVIYIYLNQFYQIPLAYQLCNSSFSSKNFSENHYFSYCRVSCMNPTKSTFTWIPTPIPLACILTFSQFLRLSRSDWAILQYFWNNLLNHKLSNDFTCCLCGTL